MKKLRGSKWNFSNLRRGHVRGTCPPFPSSFPSGFSFFFPRFFFLLSSPFSAFFRARQWHQHRPWPPSAPAARPCSFRFSSPVSSSSHSSEAEAAAKTGDRGSCRGSTELHFPAVFRPLQAAIFEARGLLDSNL